MLNLKDKLKFMMYMRDNKKSPIYLEYLESDGNQYIDTNVKPNPAKTRMIVKTDLKKVNGITGIFGTRSQTTVVDKTSCNLFIVNNKIRLDWLGTAGTNGSSLTSDTYMTYTFNCFNNVVIENEIKYQANTNKFDGIIDFSLYLFNFNNGGSPFTNGTPQRLRIAQIYDENGNIIRNFRPCLNPDTLQPAMYDTVTRKYFYNQGTGEFKYKLNFATLDYIENVILSENEIPVRKNDGSICTYDFMTSTYTIKNGKGFLNGYQVGKSLRGNSADYETYINTKIIPEETLESYSYTSNFLQSQWLFGERNGTMGDSGIGFFKSNPNLAVTGFGSTMGGVDIDLTLLDKSKISEIILKKGKLIVNEKETTNLPYFNSFKNANEIYLFVMNQDNLDPRNYKGNYYTQIFLSNKKENNLYLIPVKKEGFVGMLDILNEKEYANCGTGVFIFNE